MLLGLNSGQTAPLSGAQPSTSGPPRHRLPARGCCRGSARPICSVKPLIDHLNYGRVQKALPKSKPRAVVRALSRSKHPDARGGSGCSGNHHPKDEEEQKPSPDLDRGSRRLPGSRSKAETAAKSVSARGQKADGSLSPPHLIRERQHESATRCDPPQTCQCGFARHCRDPARPCQLFLLCS